MEEVEAAPHSGWCDHTIVYDILDKRDIPESEREPCNCWKEKRIADIESQIAQVRAELNKSS